MISAKEAACRSASSELSLKSVAKMTGLPRTFIAMETNLGPTVRIGHAARRNIDSAVDPRQAEAVNVRNSQLAFKLLVKERSSSQICLLE